MKCIRVALWAALACAYSTLADAISLNQNPDFAFGRSAAASSAHSLVLPHTAPLELEPIPLSSASAGIKLAAVKSLIGLNKTNDFGIDVNALCIERGYSLTECPSGKSPSGYCPDSQTYFTSCVCDTSAYPILASDHYDHAKECGSLATISVCSDNNGEHLSCDCSSTGVPMGTCNGSNQYLSITGTISKPYLWCKDNFGRITYPESSCRTCTAPAYVSDEKDACICNPSWLKCSDYANMEGVGSACLDDWRSGDFYASCQCPSRFTSCDSANNEVGSNECVDNGTSYYETCSCPAEWTECTDGGDVGAKSCSKDGRTYWSSCKQKVECDAPYYANAENKCVLWNGAAALVKTCSELITTTKNTNITGNILVWGTLNCGENEITVPVGQSLVGRAFFKGQYPEATDSDTNKFSKITWDFQTKMGNGLTLNNTNTVSDLTLEIKSNQGSLWQSPGYKTVALIDLAGKENIILENVDLYGDMSAVEGKALKLINSTSARYRVWGNSFLRFKNKLRTNTGSNYTYSSPANYTTYLVYEGRMMLGQDSVLTIIYTDGGAQTGFIDTALELSDNARFIFTDPVNLTDNSDSRNLFEDYGSSEAPLSKISLSGTSKMTIKSPSGMTMLNSTTVHMYNNAVLNADAGWLSRTMYRGYNGDYFQLNQTSNINANVKFQVMGNVTLNDTSTFRIKSAGSGGIDGKITMNNNAKFIIKQNSTQASDSVSVVNAGSGLQMNDSSKFFVEANNHIFANARFDLLSTTAKIYARQTNTSKKIFSAPSSGSGTWLYRTVNNVPFYIETTGQNGYNGAEDDGLYLIPALGISASDGDSVCSHMTGGYSSSKTNRDLACKVANNNDYLKGKQCDRCSSGYRLTGVTHVSKSDSRFTSTRSDFNTEISNLNNAMSF